MNEIRELLDESLYEHTNLQLLYISYRKTYQLAEV
jgi:hypothetical protein